MEKQGKIYYTVVAGQWGSGKTSVSIRFAKGKFDTAYGSTIGAGFFTKSILIDNRTTINFHIWDTAGQERYNGILTTYFRNAHAALICYDVQNHADSFNRAKEVISYIRENNQKNIVIALVGTQVDKGEHFRRIKKRDAELFAAEKNLIFMETSAKTGQNIEELFLEIGKKLSEIEEDEVVPKNTIKLESEPVVNQKINKVWSWC